MKYEKIYFLIIFSFIVIWLTSCSPNSRENNLTFNVPEIQLSELLPGGETSVSWRPFASFMLPVNNLPQELKPDFYAGKALAHQPWVKAPTLTTARDGLGPLYNARSCLACHENGGRGKMPINNSEALFSAFLRLSLPGFDEVNGVIPEPNYGDQLQSQSVALSHQLRSRVNKTDLENEEVAPEGYVYIDWQKSEFSYPDGTSVELRKPKVRIENLGYGKLNQNTTMGIRLAPPLHGLGLLEAIDQRDIEDYADSEDKNNDGISGRENKVWDFDLNKTVSGRFGLKANKANLKFQVAGAFAGDMGISNPVFNHQNCRPNQKLCLLTPNGNDVSENDSQPVEISESLLNLVVDFNRNLGVPKRRVKNQKIVLQGRQYFYQTGCQNCHRPSFTTVSNARLSHLSNQIIWPYSDLLLHDMGERLADGRSDYLATGTEWRTPPLWGIGLNIEVNGSNNLLHDGRARSVEEAILWHGGEARQAKEKFSRLNEEQRTSLISFVNSL